MHEEKLKALAAEYNDLSAKAKAVIAAPTADGIQELKDSVHPRMAAIKSETDLLRQAGAMSDEMKSMIDPNAFGSTAFTHPGTGVTFHGMTQDDKSSAYAQVGGGLVHMDANAQATVKSLKATQVKGYTEAFWENVRARKDAMVGAEAMKFLQEGLDVSGGFMVPEQMYGQIVMKEPTPTRVNAHVKRLTTGRDSLTLPKVNYATDDLYTTGMRVTWTGENPSSATVANVTDPTFGTIRVPIYTALMSLPITRDLLEDAFFDLQGWCAGLFRQTIDLLYDNMILNGTGSNQPTGILVNPNGTNQPATVNTGNASALTGDGVINLGESLPEQYEDGAMYVFNKTNTGKALRTLKDGQGRYLFANTDDSGPAGLTAGRPKTLNGYPFLLSGFMPNVGANTYPIIFGDLKGYYLVDRIGFSIEVLREIQALTNQVVLLGRIRFGGLVAEDWRLKIQKVAA